MNNENNYSIIKKRKVYHKGPSGRFKIISDVNLTKEEVNNIVFTILQEERVCEANVMARDIVKALEITSNKVKSCSVSRNNYSRWVIKLNIE